MPCKSKHGLIQLPQGRRWLSWWVAQGSPCSRELGHPWLMSAASTAQPMECSLLFLCIPVGMALRVWSPKSLSGDIPSARDQKPATCLDAGQWLGLSTLGKGELGAQGGKRGGFSSPTRISSVVIHECHWHICSEGEQ